MAVVAVVLAVPIDQLVKGPLDCKPKQYVCARNNTSFNQRQRCINLNQICDGKKDCPNSEDESNQFCELKEKFEELEKQHNENGVENDFSGTGFMFAVQSMQIEGGSNVKMFNQNSDNIEHVSDDTIEPNDEYLSK